MDGRQARGRVLAQAHGDRIRPIEGDVWYAPSSQGTGGYLVNLETGKCGCPDEAERCKHVVAVEIVRGAMVKAEGVPVAATIAPTVPAPARAQIKVLPRGDLTAEEQKHVRLALRYLSRREGGWETLAKGTRFAVKSLKNVAYGQMITASVAVRLARFAGVGVDELLSGNFPPKCPTCGQRTSASTTGP